MNNDAIPPAVWLIIAAMAASASVWCYLFPRHMAGHSLLPWRPRKPVPWSGWFALVVLAMPISGVLSGIFQLTTVPQLDESVAATARGLSSAPGPLGGMGAAAVEAGLAAALEIDAAERFIQTAWGNVGALALLTAVIYAALIAIARADLADLGLPASVRDAAHDARTGAVAAVASFAPVIMANIAANFVLQPESQHPFIEQALANPSTDMLAVVAISAIIAAPLFEETVFRLVFQGWLERCELSSVRNRRSGELDGAAPGPQMRGWWGLPLGWGPILTSGMAFGLAHWGHGTDPAALVLLGVILGYVYNRTHRILPCMVLHMIFNAFTVLQISILTGSGSV